jgi:DNA-directed RNA polymerase subunit RPC12/RpoP
MYRCLNCGAEYNSVDEIKAPGDTLSCRHCGGKIFLKEGKGAARRIEAK